MRTFTSCTLGLALLAAVAFPLSAHAQINGFNNGANFTLNTNTPGLGPTITGNTLTVTNTDNSRSFVANSVYFNTPQDISQFASQFTFQATAPGGTAGLADGITFILQNSGLNALGGGGGFLGVSGINPSAYISLNVYAPNVVGTNFQTNGAQTIPYTPTGTVNLASGDPIQVNLAYDGAVLTETLTDLTTNSIFSTNYTTDLVSILGGGKAFIGFTGGTASGSALQNVSGFTFGPPAAVPEPGSVALLVGLGISGIGFLARRRK